MQNGDSIIVKKLNAESELCVVPKFASERKIGACGYICGRIPQAKVPAYYVAQIGASSAFVAYREDELRLAYQSEVDAAMLSSLKAE